MVGSSINRPPNDNAWNYFRLVPAVQQNVQYKPLGNNTFELVYLSTLPTLNMFNSDDPPGSFHSSDIVTPHPTIPNAWKYVGRIDDRISLSTGEKVLPLPMEGRVRQEAFVREAVVFGIDRSVPGLLVFKADAAREMSDEQFISAIWSAIKAANAKAEAFGRIGREMVVCLPMDAQIPMADKQSIIRSKVYKMYEQQIQRAYDRLECGSQGGLQLSLPELERFILELVHEQISIDISDAETEFHQAGMDSLQAIRLRGLILSKVAVKAGKKLSQNVVFESGNVKRLAVRIHCSGNNEQQDEAEDGIPLMQNLISEFSTFSPHTPGSRHMSSASVVLLTGATGSLGAHLLSELLSSTTVSEVFCIVRGSKPLLRLHHALKSRKLPQDRLRHKVKVINSDISLSNLDMDDATVSILKHKLTHVIHAAWPVNFQLGLRAFKPQLQILHSLLQLCLSVTNSQPAKLIFCSSISVALATAPPAYIPETAVVKIEQAQATGYARSKLVSERILEVAISSAGARAQVLRIGQVVGDTRHGLWNDSEAWPLVIRSALTLKTLPAFDMVCLFA
jgi:nucleoside-diphosphate-sugar epimerase